MQEPTALHTGHGWFSTSAMNLSYNSSRRASDVISVVAYNWLFLPLVPLIVFATLSNLVVCIVVVRVPKLRTVNNIFLTSLAVADLMVAVLVMPLGLVKDFYGYWPSSVYLCVIWNTFDVLSCTALILHVSIISLDRYLAICDPIRFRQDGKRRSRTGLKILIVWLTSFALSSPLLILGLLQQEGTMNYDLCTIENPRFKLYGSAVAFVFPLTIIVCTYLLTAFTLLRKSCHSKRTRIRRSFSRSHQRKLNSPEQGCGDKFIFKRISNFYSKETVDGKCGMKIKHHTIPIIKKDRTFLESDRSSGHKRQLRIIPKHNEQKANCVLFLVFIIFVLAWTPFFCVNLLFAHCDIDCGDVHDLFTALTWLGWASSSLNPIIYTIFNANFRRAFYYILCGRWKKLNSNHRSTKNTHFLMPSYSSYNSVPQGCGLTSAQML